MDKKRKTILIVDDIELNRSILSLILREEYDFLEAANGKEAWNIMKREGKNIALILLDIVMPVMDGLSFLRNMQSVDAFKSIPVIFVTSETYEENIMEGVKLGVMDVIAKPFDPYLVKSRVDNLIKLTHTREEKSKKQEVRAAGVAKHARTVLIVDDIGINREILKFALEKEYRILEAENGKEALETIKRHQNEMAAVLLDIIMPVMDGMTLMKELASRKLLRGVPIIAITTEDSVPQLNRLRNLGICEVIHKPFNPNVVKNRVDYMIELMRAE